MGFQLIQSLRVFPVTQVVWGGGPLLHGQQNCWVSWESVGKNY